MAVSAKLQVPAGPWGVPVTLQTLAIPVLVALLGRNLATAAVIVYLGEGLSGLPFFATGSYLTTGGYLLAFPAAAFAIGLLYERWSRTYVERFGAVFLGTSVVFAGGAAWLTAFVTHDVVRAVQIGVLPFLIGDAAKCLVAAAVRPRRHPEPLRQAQGLGR